MPAIAPTVVVARHAMATRFEIALHGVPQRAPALRAAAEEALDEVDRIEGLLSIYRPNSELARINARAAFEPVRVVPEVARFLQRARELSKITSGAFDITAAPLVRAWGFHGGSGADPDPATLAAARACVGWDFVELDDDASTVRFHRPGVMLDPGAIGKGYALDRAVDCLLEAGVTSALVHGGTSSVGAIGVPPGETAWRIALPSAPPSELAPRSDPTAEVFELRDAALGVSAVWGKSFTSGAQRRGHVIDPRSGEPISGAQLAAVALPRATEADAISTALLVLGPAGIAQLRQSFPDLRAHCLAE